MPVYPAIRMPAIPNLMSARRCYHTACGDMIAHAVITPHGPFQTLGNRTSVVTIPYGEEQAVAQESRLAAFSHAVTEYVPVT